MNEPKIYRSETLINNLNGHDIELVFEPWGDKLTLAPEVTVKIEASSPVFGELKINKEDHTITVRGWDKSTFKVLSDDETIKNLSLSHLCSPNGINSKSYIDTVCDTNDHVT